MPEWSINFEEIPSCVYGNSEEQNKVSESSIFIINHWIIINAYYNYIINSYYNYYLSNTGLLEECDKEENMEVTGTAATSCLKRRLKLFVQCHVFAQSPPGQRPNDISSQHFALLPICVKNVSLNGLIWYQQYFKYNLYAVRYVYIHTHVLHNTETLAGQKK
jgi:hypothetical protein